AVPEAAGALDEGRRLGVWLTPVSVARDEKAWVRC
ncbi:hypothetical protein GA0115240_16756, partial [Streptomyces sp. DvalAA-14]